MQEQGNENSGEIRAVYHVACNGPLKHTFWSALPVHLAASPAIRCWASFVVAHVRA